MESHDVLVAVTGEKADEEAMRLACSIARESKGMVYVLYVIEVARGLPLDAEVSNQTAMGENVLAHMEGLGRRYKCHVDAEILQAREAGPAVVQEAEERKAALIVMGMPYKRLYGVFSMGNAMPYVLKHASCPVLVCRERMPA